MLKRRTLLALALIVPVMGLGLAAGTLDDSAALKKASGDFAAAWNKHDAKAVAACWAKDGDLIDPEGVMSVGSAEIEKYFTKEYGPGGDLAKVTIEIKKESDRMITPDVALGDWDVVLSGFTGQDGMAAGPMAHHVVVVWKKEGGSWKLAAGRPGTPHPEGAKPEHGKGEHPKTEAPKK
jgi:uncharacterized protein (TIGR02246 family)